MRHKFSDFLYNFFFVDLDKKQISHTKFLSVVGGLLMLVMFAYAVINGSSIGYDIWLVVGVALLGNRTLNKIAHHKYKDKPTDEK